MLHLLILYMVESFFQESRELEKQPRQSSGCIWKMHGRLTETVRSFIKIIKSGCGSPYAGSSECYINECIPIKAIILLEQGDRTELQQLSISETVKRIYANCTVYTWNKEFIERIINLITDLASEVPVYRLVNKQTRRVLRLLKKNY